VTEVALERLVFVLDKNAGNQKSGEDEEEIDARP
jgi:hypothetical protein